MTATTVTTLLVALFLPFPLWLAEQVVPYPYIVEELAKAVLIYFVFKEEISVKHKLLLSISVGALFGLSETMLYVFNYFQSGGLESFLLRLAVTIPFHGLSGLIIALPGVKNRNLIILGGVLAIIYHFLYNSYFAPLIAK